MTNDSYSNTTSVAWRDYQRDKEESGSRSLSDGGIVGITLTVVVVVLFVAWLIFRYCRRKHIASSVPKPAAAVPPPPPPPPLVLVPPPAPPQPPRRAVPRAPLPVTPLPSFICRKRSCVEYLGHFNLPSSYFDNQHDLCYCRKCHDPEKGRKKCGDWCKPLHGWTRFGLSLNQAHAAGCNIFKDWETNYYGTSSTKLLSILKNRSIPLDGDQLGDGTTFASGHPDPTVWTTSSSLVYASQTKFAKRATFTASDGNRYNVQVVLQCKQKADTVSVNGDEWTTKARSSVMFFGLLVRLQKLP